VTECRPANLAVQGEGTERMSDAIDWSVVENTLFEIAAADISAFAETHRDETFYGFAFDCNADYGQAMLCLNTPEFHELAIDGRHLSEEIKAGYEKLRQKFGLRPDATPRDERARKMRWALGDWKYQDFTSPRFQELWEPFEDQICDAIADYDPGDDESDENRDLQEAFLRTVCRVVIRLEQTGAFDRLARTNDFKCCVLDHDEFEDEGWARLDSVRSEA